MSATRRRRADFGSISHGTLRQPDLLTAMADELHSLRPYGNKELCSAARRIAYAMENGKPLRGKLADELPNLRGYNLSNLRDDMCGLAAEYIGQLTNALNELAPPFGYFGAHEGDGADIGFWPLTDSIDELEQFDDLADAVKADFMGEFKVVNDHGNVSVYCRHRNRKVTTLVELV